MSMTVQRKTWRCFHCDLVFKTEESARLHFGDWAGSGEVSTTPGCQVRIEDYRKLEREAEEMQNRLNDYVMEDGPLHRQIHAMAADHVAALRRSEEEGYNKGLQDGMKLES